MTAGGVKVPGEKKNLKNRVKKISKHKVKKGKCIFSYHLPIMYGIEGFFLSQTLYFLG